MKRILSVIFLLIFSSAAAQTAYFGAGYNLGNGSFKEFNFIIDRYNETREELDLNPEMANIHLTRGMSFEFGFVLHNFLFGLGFQYNRAKTEARLVDDYNVKQQRDLLLRTFSMPMELGIAMGNGSIITAPGVGINFMFHRYFTRSGPAKDIDDIEFYKSDIGTAMHAKFFVKFFIGGNFDSGLRLLLEPFYNLSFLGDDISEMNRALNPSTWSNDPYMITEGFTHYGIRLLVVLYTG